MSSPAPTAETRDYRTKLQIINRLWGHVYDLLLLVKGTGGKPLEQVQQKIDRTEYYCRPYADCDDDELRALELLQAVRQAKKERGWFYAEEEPRRPTAEDGIRTTQTRRNQL